MAVASNEMLDTLLGMDETRRAEVLRLMAGSDSAKLEALSADVESQREKREKAIERKKKEAEKQARNEAIESLSIRVEAFDFSEESLEDLENLLDEAIEFGGGIALSAIVEGVPSFTLHGLKSQKTSSGGGKGRPKKDTPTDFVDTNGVRVLGAVTDWARENVPGDILEADYLKEVGEDFNFEKKKVPFKLAGSNLAAKLVKDGFLVSSPYVAEETEEEGKVATE